MFTKLRALLNLHAKTVALIVDGEKLEIPENATQINIEIKLAGGGNQTAATPGDQRPAWPRA